MKRKMMILNWHEMIVVASVAMAAFSTFARADMSSSTELGSNRDDHKLGVMVSVLGDPVPNLLGINGAYNLTDYLRVNVGFGHTSATIGDEQASLTTIGAGAKLMVPNWSFTPVVGANLSYAILSGDISVSGLSQSGLVPYFTLGADWQARSGFNVGFGLNVAMNGVGTLPYVNLGWFF